MKIKINGQNYDKINPEIDFCYKYKCNKEGKYTIRIIYKKPIIIINYMFYDCNILLSIDLSNFNTNNVIFEIYAQ